MISDLRYSQCIAQRMKSSSAVRPPLACVDPRHYTPLAVRSLIVDASLANMEIEMMRAFDLRCE